MKRINQIRNKKKYSFIFSFISGILLLTGYGGIMILGIFNVYYFSYIHYKYTWVNIQDGNLMNTVMNASIAFFSPLAGVLEKKISPRISILLSGLMIELAMAAFYFQRNLFLIYGITIFAGMSCAISFLVPMKNACLYYPEYKGIISSTFMGVASLSQSGFIYLGENIINPGKEGLIDPDKKPYYPENVAKGSKKYFLLLGAVNFATSLLSALCFIKYSNGLEEHAIEGANDQLILSHSSVKGEEYREQEQEQEQKNDEEKNNEKLKQIEDDKMNKNATKVLGTLRFWRNIAIIGFMPFWIYFLITAFRTYASLIKLDPNFIPLLGSLCAISMGVFSPIWGFLVDKLGFQITMKILGGLIMLLSVYFIIFLNNKILYPIGVIIGFISSSGIFAAINPHVMQVYGIKYFLTIGGFVKMFQEIANFFSGSVSIIIGSFCKNGKELETPYRFVALTGFILGLFGFILTFFENDKQFVFDDKCDEKKNISMTSSNEDDKSSKIVEK